MDVSDEPLGIDWNAVTQTILSDSKGKAIGYAREAQATALQGFGEGNGLRQPRDDESSSRFS